MVKKKILYSINPWDLFAVEERKKISTLFNNARYATAIDLLKEIYKKVSENEKPFYQIMIDIVNAYYHWDRFDHFKAKDYLFKGIKNLEIFLSGRDNERLKQLFEKLKENKNFLLRIVDEKDTDALIYDLIANAERRAKLENKYDDALARLYRATEMLAQFKLEKNYSIRTNNLDLSKVPKNL